MKLSTEAVVKLMRECLYEEVEKGTFPPEAVIVRGIVHNFGFDPKHLAIHKDEIKELLDELPDPFMADKGGGWTFLNACNDKHGNQWTSFHRTMEELFCLGMAVGFVKYLMPDREMWKVFPGGMPYFVVNTNPPQS